MSVQLIRHQFTVEDYHRLVEAGVLAEDARVELIEGEIVDMTPIGLRHAAAVNRLNRWLVTGCGDRAIVQVQGPVPLGPRSEPQPDLVVLKPRNDFYRDRAPGPDDVLLLIEVADSSLPYDHRVKFPLYARAGVREAWLVDLVRNRIEVHTDPGREGYGRIDARERADALVPGAFPELSLPAGAVLG